VFQVMLGVPGWKQRYYQRKFEGLDAEGCSMVAEKYVEGLCWVMRCALGTHGSHAARRTTSRCRQRRYRHPLAPSILHAST
jgi:hypothetical protein